MTDYKEALDAFQATLPALISQNRPDLPPEVRALFVALGPHACNGLMAAMVNGPERLKAIQYFFELCGISAALTAGSVSTANGPSKSSSG